MVGGFVTATVAATPDVATAVVVGLIGGLPVDTGSSGCFFSSSTLWRRGRSSWNLTLSFSLGGGLLTLDGHGDKRLVEFDRSSRSCFSFNNLKKENTNRQHIDANRDSNRDQVASFKDEVTYVQNLREMKIEDKFTCL